MRGPLLKWCLALLLAWALSAVPVLAQGRGHGHGWGKAHGSARWEARDRDFDRDGIGFRGRERDEDFDRDDLRIMRTPRTVIFPEIFRPSGRPPGWDRGRKVGWGNCDVPPGLAKKVGCSGFVVRRPGRVVIERRPVILDRRPVVVDRRPATLFPWWFWTR